MPYTPIMASLIYVLSPDAQSVLLIHRNARPDDESLGRHNGLGGKMEPDEDALTCARRELQEEAGIHATQMLLRGTVSWPGFGRNGEDWFAFIFLVTAYEGTPLSSNPEGDLVWVDRTLVAQADPSLRFWPGDTHFLPLIFDDNPQTFHGVMPYRDGHPVRWDYTR
jgi:8-oxo-dGTP diphosphatase